MYDGAAMNETNEGQEWISTAEAARRSNVSPSTMLRWIRGGQVIAEREPKAPGSTVDRFRVLASSLPSPRAADATTASEADIDVVDDDLVKMELLEQLRAAHAETAAVRAQFEQQRASDSQLIQGMERAFGRLQAQADEAQRRAADAEVRAAAATEKSQAQSIEVGLLKADHDRLLAELEELKRQPWWRRLFG